MDQILRYLVDPTSGGMSVADVIDMLEMCLPVSLGGRGGVGPTGLDTEMVADLFATLDMAETGYLPAEQASELLDALLSVADDPPDQETLAATYITRSRYYVNRALQHTSETPTTTTTKPTTTTTTTTQTESEPKVVSVPFKEWTESNSIQSENTSKSCTIPEHTALEQGVVAFMVKNRGQIVLQNASGVDLLGPSMQKAFLKAVAVQRRWRKGYLMVTAVLRLVRCGQVYGMRADSFGEALELSPPPPPSPLSVGRYLPDAALREVLQSFLSHIAEVLEGSPNSIRVTHTLRLHLKTLLKSLRYPQDGVPVGETTPQVWSQGTPRHIERRLAARRFASLGVREGVMQGVERRIDATQR